MRKVSQRVKEELLKRPNKCQRAIVFKDHTCIGRITWEHALRYAGRQIDETWAIIKLCAYSHGVDGFQNSNILDKRKNEYIALCQASTEDLKKYPNRDWKQLKDKLEHELHIKG